MRLEDVLPTIRSGGYARRESWNKDLVIAKNKYDILSVFNIKDKKIVEVEFSLTSFDVLAEDWTCSVTEDE